MSRSLLMMFATTTLTACFGFGDDPAVQDACGDGVLDRDEECDDGNGAGGDGCSAVCTFEGATADCGDRILDPGEQCDDGNLLANDGCSPTCRLESATNRVTLRQSISDAIVPGNSTTCRSTTNVVAQNSWMRRFALADHGITGKFSIEQVTFGIEEAIAGGGATSQPVTIRVHDHRVSVAGPTIDPQHLIERAALGVMVPNTTSTLVTKPIAAEIPANGVFVVEVSVPDGAVAGHQFRIGTNMDGETRPGYFAAPECGYYVAYSLPSIVSRPIHLVMNVTGTVD